MISRLAKFNEISRARYEFLKKGDGESMAIPIGVIMSPSMMPRVTLIITFTFLPCASKVQSVIGGASDVFFREYLR